jgi:hypothetical protein
MSIVTALHNLLHDLEGVTEADLERVEEAAAAEEAKIKADVQAAITEAKAEALTEFEAVEPELKAKITAALEAIEAAVITALGS